MTPTIINVRRKLALNKLRTYDQLKDLDCYSDSDVRLIFDLYSEFSNDRIEEMAHNLDCLNEIGKDDSADEFKMILDSLLIAVSEADSLISRRLTTVNYLIPDYLISNAQDEDDVIKWALYGMSNEFIINELWRRLVK